VRCERHDAHSGHAQKIYHITDVVMWVGQLSIISIKRYPALQFFTKSSLVGTRNESTHPQVMTLPNWPIQ
jgi:hypothetical protein